jgi:hypothetical protein
MASIVKKIRAGNYESDDNTKKSRRYANKKVRRYGKTMLAIALNEKG